MTLEELAGHIDHTLLRPDITEGEIERFLEEAPEYPFASVCIPPCYVELAANRLSNSPIRVGTVVGFPLGYQTMATKLAEATGAVENGAKEIDMVMNIPAFKSGELERVQGEISEIVSALSQTIIKIIIETCYLTDEEKINACNLVAGSGAHFVKTSTGFGPGGATVQDVRLLAKTAAGKVGVKASGGIKTFNDTLEMIEAGASRIGTSSGIKIVETFAERFI